MKLKEIGFLKLTALGVILLVLLYLLFNQYNIESLLFVLGVSAILISPILIQNVSLTLQGIIFLIPLSIDFLIPGGVKLSAPSEIFTALVFIIFLMRWLSGLKIDWGILKHPLTILLMLDVGWTLVTTFTSELPSVSIKRLVMKLLFFGVYYLMILHHFSKTKQLTSIFWLYGLALIIPVLKAIYTHSLLGFNQRASILVSQPFYVEHTLYAASIAFVLPFVVYSLFNENKRKMGWFILTLLLIFALLFSYSRAAWIGVFASALLFILFRLKIKFQTLATLIVASLVVGLFFFNTIYSELSRSTEKYGNDVSQHLTSVTNLQNDASNLERVNRWVSAFEMFKAKPITGFGPGTYQFVYDRFQLTQYMTRISTHHGDRGNAHSEYLMYLSENGLAGLLIFLAIVFYSIYLSMKLLRLNLHTEEKRVVYAAILGLITFYVHGFFNSFMDSEKIAILYFGSLAVLSRVDLNNKQVINTDENETDYGTDTMSISKD